MARVNSQPLQATSPKVFVVQMPHKADDETGGLKPRFDITPARRFGEVQFLLGARAAPWHPESVITELHEKLSDFQDEDYILCIGNPILIGLSVAVAAFYNEGSVQMLQWSGKDRDYAVVRANDIFRG